MVDGRLIKYVIFIVVPSVLARVWILNNVAECDICTNFVAVDLVNESYAKYGTFHCSLMCYKLLFGLVHDSHSRVRA